MARNKSMRNTGWNGKEQLRAGIDGKSRNGKSWKWQGHVDNGTDTNTDAAFFYVDAKGFDEVQNMLNNAMLNVNRMADDIVAKVGVEGRKRATDIEEGIFRLGRVWEHAASPWHHMAGGRWKSSSKFDPSLGAYVGISSAGNKIRLMNFSFEKGHTFRYNGINPGISKARFTSQLANLFENAATWRKNSPYWAKSGSSKWSNYKAGESRDGKHYFDRFQMALLSGMADALPRAQANFDRWMAMPNTRRYA